MKIIVILKENNSDTFTIENKVCHYLDSILTNPRESKLEQGIVNHKIYDFLH